MDRLSQSRLVRTGTLAQSAPTLPLHSVHMVTTAATSRHVLCGTLRCCSVASSGCQRVLQVVIGCVSVRLLSESCCSPFYGVTSVCAGPCNGHGTCEQSHDRELVCACEKGFDPASRCQSCLPGHYGSTCASPTQSSSKIMIAVIVATCGGAVILAVIAIVMVARRRRARAAAMGTDKTLPLLSHWDTAGQPHLTQIQLAIQGTTGVVNESDLEMGAEIGHGSFGRVYRAKLNNMDVCVKASATHHFVVFRQTLDPVAAALCFLTLCCMLCAVCSFPSVLCMTGRRSTCSWTRSCLQQMREHPGTQL